MAVPRWVMVATILPSTRTWASSNNPNMGVASKEVTMADTMEVAAMAEATEDTASHTNKTSRGTLIRNIRHSYVDISCNQVHAPLVKPVLLLMVNPSFETWPM